MSRGERYANLVGVAAPFAGAAVAVVLLWNHGVDLFDMGLLVGTYLLSGFGITVGYHRLLTHRSFATYKPLEYMWAVLGCLAVEGSPHDWVADHRRHHAFPDREGDPHSPHVGQDSAIRGLLHAHIGWVFVDVGGEDYETYVRDLNDDRGMRLISKLFPLFLFASFALPTLAGWLYHGGWDGAARGLVWGALVRLFFLHHVTWSINSVCHFFGRRRFATDDRSTNVAWLALASMGESWHHNHHAFPRSAVHGLRRWEIDPSAWVIGAMERLGLAHNVVRISPERQAERLADAPATDRRPHARHEPVGERA